MGVRPITERVAEVKEKRQRMFNLLFVLSFYGNLMLHFIMGKPT